MELGIHVEQLTGGEVAASVITWQICMCSDESMFTVSKNVLSHLGGLSPQAISNNLPGEGMEGGHCNPLTN